MNKIRNMVSLTGGLGNQLFQLAFILSQSPSESVCLERNFGLPRLNQQNEPEVCSFELPTRVQITDEKDIKLFIRRVVNFALRMAISVNRRPNSLYLRPLQLIASGVISLYLHEVRQIISPVGIGFSKIRSTRFKRLYVGYFQSFIWAESIQSEMKSLRIAHPSNELIQHEILAKSENPLIVHVRLGDYVGIETFGIPSKEYYRSGIQKHVAKGDFNKIWLFSNQPDLALDFIPQEFHNKTRIIPEIGKSSAETLELMRHGVGYVIGNSTYSWWSAYLSYNLAPMVIAPSPWFKGEPSPHQLIPNSWVQIKAFE